VPTSNASLWCDSSSGMCYSLSTATATFSAAVDACSGAGGWLWLPDSAAQAGEVEGPLGLTGSSTQIWIGLNRSSSMTPSSW
jgi:hypothetical protein